MGFHQQRWKTLSARDRVFSRRLYRERTFRVMQTRCTSVLPPSSAACLVTTHSGSERRRARTARCMCRVRSRAAWSRGWVGSTGGGTMAAATSPGRSCGPVTPQGWYTSLLCTRRWKTGLCRPGRGRRPSLRQRCPSASTRQFSVRCGSLSAAPRLHCTNSSRRRPPTRSPVSCWSGGASRQDTDTRRSIGFDVSPIGRRGQCKDCTGRCMPSKTTWSPMCVAMTCVPGYVVSSAERLDDWSPDRTVAGLVVNTHSQGTVVSFDVLRGFPPTG